MESGRNIPSALPSRREVPQGTSVGGVEGHESRHLIPFGDYVLDVVMEVREGGVQLPDQVYALGRRQPTHLAPT
jgi:hypothetical protein